KNNAAPGPPVSEPFSGSGTTIIAAEMTGRVCHAIEIAPAYVDVAVKRWQSLLASKRCSTATVEASTTSPRSGHARPLPSPAKPMARPVWTPTDAQRRQNETMAAHGIPQTDIARVLGVSKPTLRKHCGTELDTGATRANSKVADFLFYGICGGTGKPAFKDERARVTAAIFWMKTRGGWSETSTHKHTGAANGDPIEVEVVTVRERLTRRIARIAAARTTGGVPETDE